MANKPGCESARHRGRGESARGQKEPGAKWQRGEKAIISMNTATVTADKH